MRMVVDYLEEMRLRGLAGLRGGFSYLSGLVAWNYNFGNFPTISMPAAAGWAFQRHQPDPGGPGGLVLLGTAAGSPS
ncbi:hypothetical protein [Candidatus Amarobacter glycogenicus]|uniref:hypothetical protein n=1 Tax=Candidatus Amarobacter glycogenicus TaxID=3140699 RepID=UPI002A149DF3|nr:hypothetical protein [Dehalococcoidia bacterium]